MRRKKLLFDTSRRQHQLEVKISHLNIEEKRSIAKVERAQKEFSTKYKHLLFPKQKVVDKIASKYMYVPIHKEEISEARTDRIPSLRIHTCSDEPIADSVAITEVRNRQRVSIYGYPEEFGDLQRSNSLVWPVLETHEVPATNVSKRYRAHSQPSLPISSLMSTSLMLDIPETNTSESVSNSPGRPRSYSLSPNRPRSPKSARDINRYSYDIKQFLS